MSAEAPPTKITRDDAEAMFMAHWAPAIRIATELHLPHQVPDFARMRNYEIEGNLHRMFGGEWMVDEPCPFNGRHCSWGRAQEAAGAKA